MSYDHFKVVDCDGHIVESVPEMAEFMSARIRQHATKPSRNRQGVFPSLDGMHFADASDDPHEVDLPAAQHEIDEVAERADLTAAERQAILADNARRFFNL